ncbi:MAG: BamA/TamA family outer membrane protein [Gammaproteobacteria bacterium]|nr:BamA/TamA family outer membrane protein [Gammaproteobacteria bacterium]
MFRFKKNKKIYKLILAIIIFTNCNNITIAKNHLEIITPDNELKSNLIHHLETDNSNISSIAEFTEASTEQIKDALVIYGYYNPKITLVNSENKTNVVTLKINPGKPVLIKKIIMNCRPEKICQQLADLNTLISKYQQETNKPLNQIIYEKTKENILQIARNNGYLDSEFINHKILLNTENKTAEITLDLQLNKLYYFSDIKILNNLDNHTDASFLASFLPYTHKQYKLYESKKIITLNNTPYNSTVVLDLQASLSRYYREVNIKTNINKSVKTVSLEISTTPIKNYLYHIGLGYGTDEGARTFGGLQIRNITSHGHKLELQGKLAQYRELAEINYVLPGFYPASDLATIGYQFRLDKKRSDNNIEKKRQQIIAEYKRNLDHGKLRYTAGLSYRQEDYKNILTKKAYNSQLLVPYIIYDQALTSNRIKTYQGHHINLLLEAADRDILSTTSFVRLLTNVKSITPLDFDNTIPGLRLITREQFGQIWHQEQDKIPPTLRFFAGGSESVRGYRFESLGPKELNNKNKEIITGGDRLVTFSAELEKPIYQYNKWSTAIFYDIGNVFNSWDNWQHNLKAGAGIGLRWQSPLGAVRLDIANALDSKDKSWRFDINIGPDL